MPLIRTLLLTALLASLAACCPCTTPGRSGSLPNLPAPITPDEQIRRITDWSHQLPRIKATTVLAGVRLDFRDDNGQNSTLNAEGTLQIRQHFDASPEGGIPPADVLLLGKSFDQPAFEAGRNAKDWWFAIKKGDNQKAWLGDATLPVNFASLGSAGSRSVLRADLVPDLLGISALPGNVSDVVHGAVFASRVMMLVNDADGTNNLYIENPNGGEHPFIAREIIVDRFTGHITEVRLYSPAGILAVRSQLTDYAPVTYADGLQHPAAIPQFPRKVVVSYPGQFLTVSLQFDTVAIWTEFKPAVFTTPDFVTQGLRVIPAE